MTQEPGATPSPPDALPDTPLLARDDPRTRYVRFGRLNDKGFAEFSFGVGSPDLMAELVMPLAAYREFCRVNKVVYLTREQEEAQDLDAAKWRYGAPGVRE